jgi:hypothetical protein
MVRRSAQAVAAESEGGLMIGERSSEDPRRRRRMSVFGHFGLMRNSNNRSGQLRTGSNGSPLWRDRDAEYKTILVARC